jgi:hypothetical protein
MMRRPYARQTASRASTDPHTALKKKLEFAPYRFIADEYNFGNRVIEMQSTAVADEISREDWLGAPLNREATGEGLSVLYRRVSRLFAELATARGEARLCTAKPAE